MMKKILNDPRIFYWSCLIVTTLILFFPLGLPIEPLQTSIDTYKYVNNFPKGSKVLYVIGISPGNYGELAAPNIAVINHLFSRGIQIIFMTSSAESVLMKDMLWPSIDSKKLVYGVDYVDMGFKAGAEVMIASLGRDIKNTFVADRDGTSVDKLPIFVGVKDANNISLVLVTTGGELHRQFINQWVAPYKSNLIAITSSATFANAQMYFNAGLLKGLLNGLRAGADYEFFTQRPGAAIKLMDMQSVLHVLLIGFLVFGNILYFRDTRASAKKVK